MKNGENVEARTHIEISSQEIGKEQSRPESVENEL